MAIGDQKFPCCHEKLRYLKCAVMICAVVLLFQLSFFFLSFFLHMTENQDQHAQSHRLIRVLAVSCIESSCAYADVQANLQCIQPHFLMERLT